MNERTQRAGQQRQLPEKLRTIASDIKNEANRKELLRIADDLDRLALAKDQRAKLRS